MRNKLVTGPAGIAVPQVFFINNARMHNGRSCIIQEEIASVFVGQFRCGLQRFFRGRKALSNDKTDLKIVSMWRYDWYANARENFQNLRKWVQSLCAPLRPFRSKLKEQFYRRLLPHVL